MLTPVSSNIPGVSLDDACLFSGHVSTDPASVVTVLGCREDEVVTISVASKLVPGGIIDIKVEDGVAAVIEEDEETHSRHKRAATISYDDVEVEHVSGH